MQVNQTTEWNKDDWNLLIELRSIFLSERFDREGDYWSSNRLLELYHQTFAQRIGWKWDAVLSEFLEKETIPDNKRFTVLDFGCGSGISSLKILEHLGQARVQEFCLWDLSRKAIDFAGKKLRELAPQCKVTELSEPGPPKKDWILCLSHLINELTNPQLDQVISLIENADYVFWVEPGTVSSSKRLIQVRERLRDKMTIVSPCNHGERCGLLSVENQHQWCHFFAQPPSHVYQSPFWKKFSVCLKIDLRSLPVSYLVLRKNPNGNKSRESSSRVIGRPRLYKGNGKFLLCSEDGVKEMSLLKRDYGQLFKQFKNDIFKKEINLKK